MSSEKQPTTGVNGTLVAVLGTVLGAVLASLIVLLVEYKSGFFLGNAPQTTSASTEDAKAKERLALMLLKLEELADRAKTDVEEARQASEKSKEQARLALEWLEKATKESAENRDETARAKREADEAKTRADEANKKLVDSDRERSLLQEQIAKLKQGTWEPAALTPEVEAHINRILKESGGSVSIEDLKKIKVTPPTK